MNIVYIESHEAMLKIVRNDKKAYLLLIRKGSDISECALSNIQKVSDTNETILVADVNKVRDIHPNYPVNTVPSLLEFSNGEFINLYKGCNDDQYYKSIFTNTVFESAKGKSKAQKNVIVYSTPSCSWCTTLKKYFDEHQIKYRNIDVSKDQRMAEEMVKKSGKQGVPQTLIGGQLVIGFDKPKIDRLLGINE